MVIEPSSANKPPDKTPTESSTGPAQAVSAISALPPTDAARVRGERYVSLCPCRFFVGCIF